MKKEKDAGHRKRLRDKYARSALSGFHDYEAIELLLTFAIPRRDVKPVAKDLLKRFGGMKGLFEAEKGDLTAITGVGEKAADLICAIKKCALSYVEEKPGEKSVVSTSADACSYAGTQGFKAGVSGFFILYLNSKNEVIFAEDIEPGEQTADRLPEIQSLIHSAIRHNARSIIILHGASVKKARTARKFLQDLALAANMVEIIVHDMIFAASAGHSSAREMGWFGFSSRA